MNFETNVYYTSVPMKPFRMPKCTKCSNTRIISADNTNVLMI